MDGAFDQRKSAAEGRIKGLRESVEEHQRLNKALRVGRVDPLAVDIIDKLTRTRLMARCRVIGTHAVCADASGAEVGMRVIPCAVATQDIDLLRNVRKRVNFATQLKKVDASMLDVLKKASAGCRRFQSRTRESEDELAEFTLQVIL